MRPTQYPWISEAGTILKNAVPCSRNDAVAVLVEKMTARAVDIATSGRGSRVSAANAAIAHLLRTSSFCEKDGTIAMAGSHKKTLGSVALDHLKRNGEISMEETGFRQSSFRTYQSCLTRLGWITVQGVKWIWSGPESADWGDVIKQNSRRRETPACDAPEAAG